MAEKRRLKVVDLRKNAGHIDLAKILAADDEPFVSIEASKDELLAELKFIQDVEAGKVFMTSFDTDRTWDEHKQYILGRLAEYE